MFLCFCTVGVVAFYFVKKDVKKAIGMLSRSSAKREIHYLKMANKKEREGYNNKVFLPQETTELLKEELKPQFIITRQIIYIHTMEDI